MGPHRLYHHRARAKRSRFFLSLYLIVTSYEIVTTAADRLAIRSRGIGYPETADPGVPILEHLSQFELYLPTTGVVTNVMNNPVGVRLVQQTARETSLTTEWTYRYVLP